MYNIVMEKSMHNSLMSIKSKYDELTEKINTPEVAGNIKEYKKVEREINNIKDIVRVFNVYLNAETTIKDSKEILATESDAEMIEFAKMEISENEKKLPDLEAELKILLLPKDENDDKNVIVEIRGAAGGDEANIFAGDLYDIYKKWSGSAGMKISTIEMNKSDAGGFSLIVFKVEGEKPYSKLKFESGVHRVQRIPATETQGRVHTSTATVTVMPEADETVEVEIKDADLRIDTYRSSGAGGQSVNTTDSAVRITHLPTGVWASSQDGKNQISNKELAMKVLRSRLYEMELRKKQEAEGEFRKLAGSGARSEKIRTYNYPQDRVTDHRIGFSASLKGYLDGKIDNVINALLAEEQAEKIKEAGL